MLLNQIESIPCQVSCTGNGFATVTFTLPEENINGFVALLTSLASLFRGLGWKTKTNIDAIHARNKATESERNNRIQEFEDYVCLIFSDFAKTVNNPRECLSLTASRVHMKYDFSSYDIVKNCLSKNKLLKNTGFYKSRHKIE